MGRETPTDLMLLIEGSGKIGRKLHLDSERNAGSRNCRRFSLARRSQLRLLHAYGRSSSCSRGKSLRLSIATATPSRASNLGNSAGAPIATI